MIRFSDTEYTAMYMNLLVTVVWNKISISVGFIIRNLPTYVPLKGNTNATNFIF